MKALEHKNAGVQFWKESNFFGKRDVCIHVARSVVCCAPSFM
jgi:hypothetical protein